MTATRHDAAAGSDTLRQVVVVVSHLLAIVGAVVGSGAFGGTPIAEAAGGALSADATLIAPAGAAFSIWSVIYVGLAAYTRRRKHPNASVISATRWPRPCC